MLKADDQEVLAIGRYLLWVPSKGSQFDLKCLRYGVRALVEQLVGMLFTALTRRHLSLERTFEPREAMKEPQQVREVLFILAILLLRVQNIAIIRDTSGSLSIYCICTKTCLT